ncbi:MAG TPA: immunoglobulin domain-containing protein, partial [Verrucomicrobiae bacterium]|nr:immunoglobulin domain-containing protein [Verrucomicrobiae bacterium]
MLNSLLAENTPANAGGIIVDTGHNLSSDPSCAFTNINSFNNTVALLGLLTDNGGPTLSIALLAGSPAIDAADTHGAPPLDQRGFPRPIGQGADIGAYEYGASMPLAPPIVANPPQGGTVRAGGTFVFTVVAAGAGSLTYQWREGGIPVTGETRSVLVITNSQIKDQGMYSVTVSNAWGTTLSQSAMLVVDQTPWVVSEPVNYVGNPGEQVTFAVVAAGPPPLGFQWFKDSLPLEESAEVSGVHDSELILANVDAAEEGVYWVVVSNAYGTVTSSTATLTLNPPPIIVEQPSGGMVRLGSNFTFTVVAIGTSPLSYQWRRNGEAIGNATSSALSLTNVQTTNEAKYSAAVTSAAGTTISGDAALVVEDPFIANQPQTQVADPGGTVGLKAIAVGTPPLTYQWYKDGFSVNDGATISGAHSPELTLTCAQQAAMGKFCVVVSNDHNSATSSVALVTLKSGISDADWLGLGSGIRGPNPVVCALAVSGSNLYAGGVFDDAGEVTARGVAKWDGGAWSALGSAISDPLSTWYVQALAASGHDLYVAGVGWTNFVDVQVRRLGKWDGTSWSGTDAWMDGRVNVLAADGTNVYAGGQTVFKAKDGNWIGLGSFEGPPGVEPEIVALAVRGTNVYAGGWFSAVGGLAASNIAKWDGHSWAPVGLGTDHNVLALAVSDCNLYAGGDFTNAGGVAAHGIARWDGTAWSALGSGVNGWVRALAVSGNEIYAGGTFTVAGGVPANHIAKWDGTNWSALASGVTPWEVDALAADGLGHLFVGGMFTMAGTNVTPCIAQLNVGRAPSISQLPQSQTAELLSKVDLTVNVAGYPAVTYLWFSNGTNLLSCGTSNWQTLTNIQFSQSGTYVVVATNAFGAVTSAPVQLNVISAVEHRQVPVLKLTGVSGSVLNLDYTDNLRDPANWKPIGSFRLSRTSRSYFDVAAPFPMQRFYRVWQSGPAWA